MPGTWADVPSMYVIITRVPPILAPLVYALLTDPPAFEFIHIIFLNKLLTLIG